MRDWVRFAILEPLFSDSTVLSDDGETKVAEVFVEASCASQPNRSCHSSKIGEIILIECFNECPFNTLARHCHRACSSS